MNDFDDMITGAVGGRADAAPIEIPDFTVVLAARQDRLRRRTALAAGGLVVAGLVGIGVFATAGDESPSVAGEPSSTRPLGAATSTIPPGGDIDGYWFCTGRLNDPFGGVPPSTAGEPFPVTTDEASTFPATSGQASTTSLVLGAAPGSETTTTVWRGDSGYFAHCAPVGSDGFPASTVVEVVESTTPLSPPTSSIGVEAVEAEELARLEAEAEARRAASELEARRLSEQGVTTHIVEAGDDAILIADRYCVSVEDLVVFNGWTSAAEFPFPNELVRIPSTKVADCVPPPPTTAGG